MSEGGEKLNSSKVKIQSTMAFEITHIYFYSLSVFLANSLETPLHLLSIFVNVELKKKQSVQIPQHVFTIYHVWLQPLKTR